MNKVLAILVFFLPFTGLGQWEIISPPVDYMSNSFKNLHFINKDTGFVVGTFDGLSTVIRTLDGGNSWDTTRIADITTGVPGNPYSITFPSDSVGYMACTWKLFKTLDGGENWFQIDTGEVYTNTTADVDVLFLNNDTGYVGWADGGAGGLLTTDGGLSWVQDANLLGVRHFNQYNGLITSCAEAWLVLDKNTLIWTVYDPVNYGWYHYRNAINMNGKIIVIGNKMGSSSAGLYSYTEDFGQTWVAYEMGGSLEDIVFVNDTTGFMVGGFWGTLRTTDGGDTWFKTEIDDLGTGMSKAFREIYFVNDTLGFAVSGDGIYKTTNAGGVNQQEVYFWPYDLSVEEEKGINVGIYPNPAQNVLCLDADEHELHAVRVYSLDGREVLSQQLTGHTINLDISEWPVGTYLMVVETNKGRYRAQVVKE